MRLSFAFPISPPKINDFFPSMKDGTGGPYFPSDHKVFYKSLSDIIKIRLNCPMNWRDFDSISRHSDAPLRWQY